MNGFPSTIPASASSSAPADPHSPHALTVPQRVYVWLTAAFVTALLAANILGVKLFSFTLPIAGFTIPVEHTVGMLSFPITFLLTDLLNEYYGKRATRRVTYIAFAMGAIAFVLIWIARRVPTLEGIPGTATAASFENVFGAAALMYLASLGAFLVGSLLDIAIFGAFKRLTGGRLVWLRATGSTLVSQLVDSFVITILFFQVAQALTGGEAASFRFVIATALTGYILKFVIAVVLTPVIYLGRWILARWFGLTPIPASAA
ncbi:MAG: queuosine precursor transporter [Planctomycetota bacterium]|nr:queuosine precursor transporter [Planctomycetota bacterium]